MTKMQADPSQAIYVGDQPADCHAARAAGVNFLGVAYGWEYPPKIRSFLWSATFLEFIATFRNTLFVPTLSQNQHSHR